MAIEPTVVRSGEYRKQPLGYSAFVPAALPPDPGITFDGELVQLLARAEREIGRLDGATVSMPNPDMFVFMYVRKEAVLSSQIEGTQSSLSDILEAEASIHNPNHPQDVDEVSNYVGALNFGLAHMSQNPLSVDLLLLLHKKLMEGTAMGGKDAGTIRVVQNWIGKRGSTIDEAIYVPPPPSHVQVCLYELESFLRSKNEIPDLVKVGMAHAQFESIHPFLDGNGRVGRLLVSLAFREFGVMRHPLLYLSAFFRENRTEYYARLQGTRDRGDWESWLKFFLRGVGEVAEEAGRTAKAILNLRESHRELIRQETGKGAVSALELLDTLYYRPFVTVQSASEIVGLTFAATNRLIGRLVELKVLTPTSERARNRAFCYKPLLALFES